MKNVLVVKEHYDEEVCLVYELPDNYNEAGAEAKRIFKEDVEEERRESAAGIDENNTYWDEDAQFGQIQWRSMNENGIYRRSSYDVVEVQIRK